MSITECVWCCDENCELLGLDLTDWIPFKALCGSEYKHDSTLSKVEFDIRYNGLWHDLCYFAKYLSEESTNIIPDYILQCVDWGKVWARQQCVDWESNWDIRQCVDWENVWVILSIDFVVYDDHVFSVLC